MTSAMAAFGVTVCGTSLICYLLMTRLRDRRSDRKSSRGSSGSDAGDYSGGDGGSDGGSHSNWFGGDHSRPIIPALPAIPPGATAGEAAMAVATDAFASAKRGGAFDQAQQAFLDSF